MWILSPTCILFSESRLLPAEPSSTLLSHQHLDSCCLGSPYVLRIALATSVFCRTISSFPPHIPLISSASSVSHQLMEKRLYLPILHPYQDHHLFQLCLSACSNRIDIQFYSDIIAAPFGILILNFILEVEKKGHSPALFFFLLTKHLAASLRSIL